MFYVAKVIGLVDDNQRCIGVAVSTGGADGRYAPVDSRPLVCPPGSDHTSSASAASSGSGRISRRKVLALGGGLAGGAVAASASPASASTDWLRLPVVTANIGRTNPGAREAAIRDVRFCDAGRRPLVGWQEIQEGDGDSLERSYITKYFGDAYANPFLWNDSAHRVPALRPRALEDRQPGQHLRPRRHRGRDAAAPDQRGRGAARQPPRPRVRADQHALHRQRPQRRPEPRPARRVGPAQAEAQGPCAGPPPGGPPGHLDGGHEHPDYAKATGRNAERQVFFRGFDRINWMPGDGRVRLDLLGTDTVDMRVDGHDAHVAVFRIRLV
jgi:hypothetical protein